MITRKSKIIFSAIALLVLAGAIGVGAYHVFAVATNQAGVGYGAIGMDSSFNVSVGSSSPAGIARFVVNASSGASTYTLKALSSTGASLFSVDNSGNVVTAGSLTAGSFVGNLSGTDAAGNISSGAFGANTGGGNYSFPASVGIGTASPASQLMVYGSAGTGAPVTGGGTLLVGDSALGSTNAGGAVLFGGGNSSGQYFAGIKGALQNGSGNASGNLNFYTRVNATDGSLTQQMTILSSGNVGIGTTGPGYKLDVEGGQVNASGGFCIAGSCIASWPTGNVTSVFGRTGAVVAASGDYSVGQVTGAAPLASPTFSGNIGLSSANPYLTSGGSYIVIPNGLYVSGGTPYFSNQIQARGGVHNDGAAYLELDGGTSGYTYVNGSLGIGTSAPGASLDVNGASMQRGLVTNTTGGFYTSFSTAGNTAYGINAPGTDYMGIGPVLVGSGVSGIALGYSTSPNGALSPVMTVAQNGQVGIGTTGPAQKLSVAGTIQSTSGGIMFPDGTTQTTAASGSTVVTAGNVSAGTFGSNTGGGNYAFSGNVGIGATTASVKLVVSGAANASSPTLGSAAVGESALLSNNGLYGLYSGVSNDGDVWMQAQRNDAGTSVYNILLNPNGGNVGIGTTGPSGKLDVYADNIASATAGDITLEHPTSGGASSIIFPSRSNYGSDYGFITYYDENTTYAYWGTSAENSALVIGSQNDGMNSVSDVVALQGDAADVIGTAAYPSTMIVNAANNVGIGTTAPGQKLDVAGGYIRSDTGYCIGGSCITGWPSGAVTSVFGRSGAVVAASGDYSVAQVTGAAPLASPSFTGTLALPATYGGASFTDGGGDAASYSADTIELSSWQGLGMYNPTSGGAYTNQISGFYDFRNGFWDTKAYPRVNGTAINSIFAPLANPTFTGNLTVAGNLSVGNKITATTFDPVYTIGGTNYATYLPGMTGVKEETAGTLDLQRNSDGSYSSTINFASEPTGGDLWLFAKATDMPGAMSQLVVSLTPSFSGNVWYEKNAALGTLTIHGSAAGEVSYNLTAPRFDASQWTNIGDPNAKGLLVK